MKSQTTAIIILIILGIVGITAYASNKGKLTFAVKPGASFEVVSYNLYDKNGKQIDSVEPGQDVYAKVCVKVLNWDNGNSVYVEGGIIPNSWYSAGTYAVVGTFKNIPEFSSMTSSKCCSSNEFYGGTELTFGSFDSIGTVKCTTFTFTAPSESSHDHCNNLGSAWAGYGNNYHFGVTLFNGYCYPSSQEKVYDVEWYKTLTMKQVQSGSGSSGSQGSSQSGSGGSNQGGTSNGGTPGTTTTQPSAYIENVLITKTFGQTGEPIEIDVKLKNTNDYPYTYCVEGGIAPRTWQTFSLISFSTTEPSDVRLDKCCPQNEFYSSECETLQPNQEYTFKVYPHVPSQESLDHCHGHGSAWAGYGDNYVIGVSVVNDKCYPDPDEIQFYPSPSNPDWNTKFIINNPTVVVNQTGPVNQTYTPGPVYGQPIQEPVSGEYVLYGIVLVGIGLIGYTLYKRKR